jgi:putative exosortase-associated protein (TIGR04073 family)
MRKFSTLQIGLAIALIASVGFGSSMVIAQSYDPEQDIPNPTLFDKRANKFGRGFSNLLWGWTEIPMTMHMSKKRGKPLTYILGTAPVLGTVRAFMRTGTGVYEMVTFMRSSQEINYEPLIEPDYIF